MENTNMENTNMENTNMENPINYPYKAGALQGFIQFLSSAGGLEIPGVEIRDRKAFENFIESELKRIDEQSRNPYGN